MHKAKSPKRKAEATCADLTMETRRCATLGKGLSSCFHKRRKAMDTINIDKGLVWKKRNLLRKRNDGSPTEMTTIQVV